MLTRLHSGSEESVVDDQNRKRTGVNTKIRFLLGLLEQVATLHIHYLA